MKNLILINDLKSFPKQYLYALKQCLVCFKNLTWLVIGICLYLDFSWAITPRVSSQKFNKSETQKLFLSPGLASLIIFPCDIEEALVGNSEYLSAQISTVHARELILFLKSQQVKMTNLIVRCRSGFFVFDILPSPKNHQDIFEIKQAFGRPQTVATPSEPKKWEVLKEETLKKVILEKPQLIEEEEVHENKSL